MLNLSIFAMALCQIVIYLEYIYRNGIENVRLHVCDFGTRVLLYIYIWLYGIKKIVEAFATYTKLNHIFVLKCF